MISPQGQLPPNNYPWIIPVDNYPTENCPLWNPPRIFTNHRTFPPPYNYPWIVPPRTVTSWNSPQDNCPLDLCPSDMFPWIIPPWATTPWQLTPHEIPSRKWQRTISLENYHGKIYRRRSKKVLFTQSSLEILNKFWKKIKQGAVHAISWRYFTLRKSFL